MNLEDLMGIWPHGVRIFCSSVEERKIVTEIALEAGADGCTSGYSNKVLAGNADSAYMHPKAVWRGSLYAPYITYHGSDRGFPDDISFDEFMSRVSGIRMEDLECGDLESLLT